MNNQEALNKLLLEIEVHRNQYESHLQSKKVIFAMSDDELRMTVYFFKTFLLINSISDLQKRLLLLSKTVLELLQSIAHRSLDERKVSALLQEILDNFIEQQDVVKLAQSIQIVRDNFKEIMKSLVRRDRDLEELWKYTRYINN